jgi:hypothetical protein
VVRDGRLPPANPQLSVLHKDDGYVLIDKPADVRIDGPRGPGMLTI